MVAILMSGRERKRLVVLSQVGAGKLRLRAASELLGISYRQMKRLWRRYQAEGDRGLVQEDRVVQNDWTVRWQNG